MVPSASPAITSVVKTKSGEHLGTPGRILKQNHEGDSSLSPVSRVDSKSLESECLGVLPGRDAETESVPGIPK